MGVKIGAFASVEADVELGDQCVVASGTVIKSGVTAGCYNEFCEHAVIGGAPQPDARPADVGRVIIGDHNVFREHVTVHRGLKPGCDTVVGSSNYVMAGAHFGHDSVVGNSCIFANGSMLGGHVQIEDKAFVSGAVAVHQFCRIGRLAMVGGHARVTQDIPPYMLVDGQSGCIVGLNVVGLRRSGGRGRLGERSIGYPRAPDCRGLGARRHRGRCGRGGLGNHGCRRVGRGLACRAEPRCGEGRKDPRADVGLVRRDHDEEQRRRWRATQGERRVRVVTNTQAAGPWLRSRSQ